MRKFCNLRARYLEREIKWRQYRDVEWREQNRGNAIAACAERSRNYSNSRGSSTKEDRHENPWNARRDVAIIVVCPGAAVARVQVIISTSRRRRISRIIAASVTTMPRASYPENYSVPVETSSLRVPRIRDHWCAQSLPANQRTERRILFAGLMSIKTELKRETTRRFVNSRGTSHCKGFERSLRFIRRPL